MSSLWMCFLMSSLVPLALCGVRTSGRLVATPSLQACKTRPKHYMDKRTGHYYFFSGKSKFGSLQVSQSVRQRCQCETSSSYRLT